jgi:single-stranded-DNA-specific exonuclease
LGTEALMPELGIDGALAAGAAGPDLVEVVERLGPFGAGNAEPRFALPNMRILRADVVGAQHVRCILGDGAGAARLKAIAFRCLEGELGPALLNGQGSAFHLAGHLRADNWQGRSDVQLMIDDAARVAG